MVDDTYDLAGDVTSGASANHIFRLTFSQPGAYRIALRLWREWEGDASISDQYTITVDVTDEVWGSSRPPHLIRIGSPDVDLVNQVVGLDAHAALPHARLGVGGEHRHLGNAGISGVVQLAPSDSLDTHPRVAR